jgi:hypothetical protein
MAGYRVRRGKISYIAMEPERLGEERGRERFHMSFSADGRRTLSAVCEIDDEPDVLRHAVLTYGADWRPTEAMIRMDVAGAPMGSGWIDVQPHRITLEGRNSRSGRVSGVIEPQAPVQFLGCDPIVSDGWHLSNFDLSRPDEDQATDGVLSSADNRGGTGPTLWTLRTGMRFHGRESLTVPAGTFDALHFELLFLSGQMFEAHPPYHIWTTADGDYVALRSEQEGRRYDLVELEDGW